MSSRSSRPPHGFGAHPQEGRDFGQGPSFLVAHAPRLLLRGRERWGRATVLRTAIDLANAIRGALRTFGLALAAGPGEGGARAFERRAVAHLAARPDLVPIVRPCSMLGAPPVLRSPDMTGRSAALYGRTRAVAS